MPEQLLVSQKGSRFDIYVTVPDSHVAPLRMFPDFAESLLKQGLVMEYDDVWDWRYVTKRTVEKALGFKLVGSKTVIQMWGYRKEQPETLISIQKSIPFEVDCRDISAMKLPEMRRIQGK